MKKILSLAPKIFTGLIALLYLICLGLAGYVLSTIAGLAIWEVVLILTFMIATPTAFIWALIVANRNSLKKPEEEEEMLQDIVNIKRGGFSLKSGSYLAKYYVAALIFAFCFPLIAKILRFFIQSPDIATNTIMGLGYITIIGFIVTIIRSDRNKK